MTSEKETERDGMVRASGYACALGLGGFLAWAGFAPLEEGVAAGGKIIVENDRQVVQHFEGGIIEAINVREGELVEAGQIVVTLEETASLSNRDQLQTQIGALAAREARLQAVLEGLEVLDFSALEDLELNVDSLDALVAEELKLFDAHRLSLEAEVRLLSQRASAARRTASLKDTQIDSTRSALGIAEGELERNAALLSNQMVRMDQVTRLEREVAGLNADIARLTAERDEATASASDAERQIDQLHAERRQTASAELRDARAERLAGQESLNAAQDVLDRAVIVAPVSGEVLNLGFTTPGSVVSSAETIMEIVPEEQRVVASVRIRPTDRASIFVGQTVRTQISAYRSWESPRIEGEVQSVSADLKTDPVNGTDYYEARILLATDALAPGDTIEIVPGMPVDAFIYSGHSRTTLDYLFAPMMESVFKGLRTG
ncbi:MAG: HlyD family type I secretion periplasmic adaptor subunit [Pseudomonadota bacterium]